MWQFTSYSPLRISFAGGGTDISPFFEEFGSCVVNTTIDRGVTIRYQSDPRPLEVSSRDMVRSQISGFDKQRVGMPERIIDLFRTYGIETGRILINNDVPPGSGLGSSSALVLGLLKLIYRIRGEELDKKEAAERAYEIEKDSFKITLGRQDPFAISYGGFKVMEMGAGVHDMTYFDIESEFLKKLQSSLLLVYTGRTRESSVILKNQVRRSEVGETGTLQKLSKMRDIAKRMKGAIEHESLDEIAELMRQGWQIKRSLSENVSNPHVDGIIAESHSHGGVAAKLLGGGAEGFVLVICPENIDLLQREMLKHSPFVIRVSFDPQGTRII